ncbi:MAG TPA: molybdopterin-dependent oxidoreductase [Phenylobacterium sp.]
MKFSTLALTILALAIPQLASAQAFTVVGLDGTTKTLSAEQMADMPRESVKLSGKKTYEGPVLAYVLREVGAPSGAKLHGPAMRTYVVVRGKDAFAAVLSLAETDKDFSGGLAILADKVDGQPLGDHEAPYRLVVDGDLKGSRSVWGATKAELKTAE